ncbi:MAG: nuclear transport factor 2 family protein [Rhodospirillaceae bacterium]
MSAIEMVKDTIYRGCLHLDDEQWNDWLAMCDDSFEYKITSYSPEIQKDMIYLSGNKKEMASMCEMLPHHNTDHSPLKRHVTVYSVDVSGDGKSATAVTSVLIYQTLLDGINSHVDAGESRLFCVGRYIDTFAINGKGAKMTSRETRLENRRLDKGSHWPL